MLYLYLLVVDLFGTKRTGQRRGPTTGTLDPTSAVGIEQNAPGFCDQNELSHKA